MPVHKDTFAAASADILPHDRVRFSHAARNFNEFFLTPKDRRLSLHI